MLGAVDIALTSESVICTLILYGSCRTRELMVFCRIRDFCVARTDVVKEATEETATDDRKPL